MVAGNFVEGNPSKSLRFEEEYELIGLEGLGTEQTLDSLKVIVFETACDIANPDGPVDEVIEETDNTIDDAVPE